MNNYGLCVLVLFSIFRKLTEETLNENTWFELEIYAFCVTDWRWLRNVSVSK